MKIFEFKYFPHGFLNYDVPLLFKEAGLVDDLLISHISEEFGEVESKKKKK